MYLIITDKTPVFEKPEIVNGSRAIFIMNVLYLNKKFIKTKDIYTYILVCIEKSKETLCLLVDMLIEYYEVKRTIV